MNGPPLSEIFQGVTFKRLAQVDLPRMGSNQHEINGSRPLQKFFGTNERTEGSIEWFYFPEEGDTVMDSSAFTFYDARAKHPVRTEWRLYYAGDFLQIASEGDLLVLLRTEERILGLVFEQDSTLERAASILFNFQQAPEQQKLFTLTPQELESTSVEFVRQRILDDLDLSVVVPARPDDEALVLARFGRTFPKTLPMSEFAREQCPVVPPDPDGTLVMWLEREEALFRALERVIVQERLDQGFADVEDFISYSLSVQNRRKSRMGHSFEHQLAALFTDRGLPFSRQAYTERKEKPDFLFPGIEEYRDRTFPVERLKMLAAKSTCKDRWRQILTEAARIPDKHLCTLEPGISEEQTGDMREKLVTLVVPIPLHTTYTAAEREVLMSVDEFIQIVKATLP